MTKRTPQHRFTILDEEPENKQQLRASNSNNSMCFPATAALEKLILAASPLNGEDPTSRIQFLQEPSSLRVIEEEHDDDGDHLISCLPSSPLGFPPIEWNKEMEHNHNTTYLHYRSMALMMDSPSSLSINSKEEADSFLDRFLADNNNEQSSVQSQPFTEQTLNQATPFSSVHNNTSSKHGRLVRSIALGSRLALLDTPLDIVSSDKRFCATTAASHHHRRHPQCTY